MKNLYLTICLILFSQTTVFSQYIVVENRIWSSLKRGTEGGSYSLWHTKFEGDTIFNGLTYKKIWRSSTSYPYEWVLSSLMIREAEGNVYTISASDAGKEQLLYNFNLKEGDAYYYRNLVDSFTVDSIRVKELQGNKLKHIYLSQDPIKTAVWVEAIGNFGDVLSPFYNYLIGANTYLLCLEEYDYILYQNPKFNNCDEYTNVKETLLIERLVSIYENGSGDIRILQNNGSKGEITFLTPDGKQVLSTTLVEPETTLCAPSTGLLLYRFVSTNGQVQTGKVVVR
jgi:hypothetical protein